jgi:hypothetical protein
MRIDAPTVAVPTVDVSSHSPCFGVGLYATLRGNPSDPRVTWLEGDTGRRREIVWPRGYTARFNPNLEVLDEAGQLRFREGDAIQGACVVSENDDDPLMLDGGR